MTEDGPKESMYPWELMEDKVDSAYRSFLFYGASGTLKTRLSAQFPKPLILACDPGDLGGALSAQEFNPKHIKIDSYEQLQALLPMIKAQAGKEFETLVVDSLTYLNRIIMRDILKLVQREIPRFDEWNLCTMRMRNFLDAISNYDCDIVMTAVEGPQKDELSGGLRGLPNLPGKLAEELPQAVDVCCRLLADSELTMDQSTGKAKREAIYTFQSVKDNVWIGMKDRTGTLPGVGTTEISPFLEVIVKAKKARMSKTN